MPFAVTMAEKKDVEVQVENSTEVQKLWLLNEKQAVFTRKKDQRFTRNFLKTLLHYDFLVLPQLRKSGNHPPVLETWAAGG